MRFENVVIESMGVYLPETFVSSLEIEQKLSSLYERLKLHEGRLELQTGIKKRGLWPVGTPPSGLSAKASKYCLERSRFSKNEIGLLIHSSVCRDFLEPATASRVHYLLEMPPQCAFFDLSNACLGFLSAMEQAGHMIERGVIQAALICSGENGGPLLEKTIETLGEDHSLTRKTMKKYVANLTIGSAAVAFILTHKSFAPHGSRVLNSMTLTDTQANHLCEGSGDVNALVMETQSEELLKAGISLAQKTFKEFCRELDWGHSSIDKAIGHQVGVAHRHQVLSSLDLPLQKDYSTFEELGNTGSAAVPVTMMKALEAGHIKKGDRVALLGIGSGLASTMMGVQF